MRTSKAIRQAFLDFFREKSHLIVPSMPVVLKDDPTLLFTNSGMVQFKDCFLGTKQPAAPRIADTQKCLRVSGKHNDLEDVGYDTYHHTMFEMLGNWSFGDYYKPEAIAWSWELLTERLDLDPDRLYVTVFGGDAAEGVPADEDAAAEWAKHTKPERILRFGKKANFWEMGEIGPCGPCSEIHYDLRTEAERATVDGASLVNADHPQVVEIWNNVFIQYQRKADRSLSPLPAQHVDTGMGFERLCMVMQGVQSTYDIDLFAPFKAFLQQLTGINYTQAPEKQQIAIRVIIDHIRAITFAIGDGQIPANTGAGYVIRRILRRASRYAYAHIGLAKPFLHQMVALMAQTYAGVFDEVVRQQEFIARIIHEEEQNFLRKLVDGTSMFDDYLAAHPDAREVGGEFAFRLYDTFGFPVDLTQLMARERGLAVDMQGFEAQLAEQKKRSRAATELKTGDWVELHPMHDLPRFLGYDTLSLATRILRYRTLEAKGQRQYQVVLEETPFYAESGGQAGDTGTLRMADGETIQVLDTRRENELIVHFVDRLPTQPDTEATASVDATRRSRTAANHTATHLLHAALRRHLGTHVEQRGSLVNDAQLRFDFSHFARLSEAELEAIEQEVNAKIHAAIPLAEHRAMPIAEAKALGAMALFGEKYGEQVRVVIFDPAYSVELCGGTHVPNTQEIRLFKLVNESSSAAGIRRIEALTGEGALAWYADRSATLDRVAETLGRPQQVEKAVQDLAERVKQLEKSLEKFQAEAIARLRDDLLARPETRPDGIALIRARVPLDSAEDLKALSFELKKATENTLIVLGCATADGKAMLSVILSDDLAATKRLHAATLIRDLAKHIQGGGGGQDFYATAGGKLPAGIDAALAALG